MTMPDLAAIRPPRSGDLVWTSLSVPRDTWTLVIADPSFAIRFVVSPDDIDPDYPLDTETPDEPTVYDITTTMSGLIDLGRQRPRPLPDSLETIDTDASEHAELGTFDYDGPFPTVLLCEMPCAAGELEVLSELQAIEFIRCGLLASLEDKIKVLEASEAAEQARIESETRTDVASPASDSDAR
jgi:hypothetical protein